MLASIIAPLTSAVSNMDRLTVRLRKPSSMDPDSDGSYRTDLERYRSQPIPTFPAPTPDLDRLVHCSIDQDLIGNRNGANADIV
jgi:hypothetical protein